MDDNMGGNRLTDLFLDWLFNNKGKVLGVILGLLFGWLTVKHGFLLALFVAICVALGYLLGNSFDQGGQFFREFSEKLRTRFQQNRRR